MGSFTRQLVFIFALHVLVVLAGLALGMRAGWAMAMCFTDGERLIAHLASQYGEADIGGGQVSDAVILRIFASPGGSSFSIVQIATDGSACIVSSGTELDVSPPPHPFEKES